MSIETWLDEYYPVRAVDVAPEDAADHALLKWTGRLPENLTRHGMRESPTDPSHIRDNTSVFVFSAVTCVWCRIASPIGCSACPAVQVGMPQCSGEDSVYDEANGGDIQPILEWIKEAKRRIEDDKAESDHATKLYEAQRSRL